MRSARNKRGSSARSRWLVLSVALLVSPWSKSSSLPNPLGLRYVLEQLDYRQHPDLLQAQARQLLAEAESQAVDAAYSMQVRLDARAQWVNPSPRSFDPSRQDHRLSLVVSKRLYDFGVTGELEKASQSLIQASAVDLDYARRLHQIVLTRKYFDVLLADLEYAWANEAMSMEYVTLDKARDRHALKQLDDVQLLQQEASYQQSLTQRQRAELRQRSARAALAEAMNRPGDLPAELELPRLHDLMQTLPDPEALIQQAMARAPQLRAQQQRVLAAEARLHAASSQWLPSLSADAEYVEYKRDLPSRENWRAGISLAIPLMESGIDKADVAAARARLMQQRADLHRLQSQLRQEIYQLWQSINALQAQSRALAISQQYASRALDKSRGEYELELRTDFGDAQVRVSEMRYKKAQTDYQLQIEKMQLALLIGADPTAGLFAAVPEPGDSNDQVN